MALACGVIVLGGLILASRFDEARPRSLDAPAAFTATVVRVIDGDTVVLDNGERLRYIGIDTPELHHPTKGVEALADEARRFNASLVLRQRVTVECDVERRDRYGRLLGYCFLKDGTFVNAELVRQGFAKPYTVPPNIKYVERFQAGLQEARTHRRGLWGRR